MIPADKSPVGVPVEPGQRWVRAPIRIVGSADDGEDRLIRRLALDRLRDLRDDGVTMAYIGRMYGVSGERMEAVETELRR
ncbi:MAG: hypothetical protein GEU90_20355 [Gemmatimonas sp.]|nr:hypothetical protein [Gemmatimonas sp.]